MDKTLTALSREARRSTDARGHEMPPFARVTDTLYRSACRTCGAEADINSKPAPNQTDIAGPAVAENCPIAA